MLRRHRLPRSAPPAPSDTDVSRTNPHAWHTSAWQSTVERSGSNRHKCPFPRRGHAGTTSFCSGISPVDASRAPRPAGGPGPPRPGRRRRRQPACHRPAPGRRRRTPHSRAPREPPVPATETRTTPTAAASPELATLPRTARSPKGRRIGGLQVHRNLEPSADVVRELQPAPPDQPRVAFDGDPVERLHTGRMVRRDDARGANATVTLFLFTACGAARAPRRCAPGERYGEGPSCHEPSTTPEAVWKGRRRGPGRVASTSCRRPRRRSCAIRLRPRPAARGRVSPRAGRRQGGPWRPGVPGLAAWPYSASSPPRDRGSRLSSAAKRSRITSSASQLRMRPAAPPPVCA